MRILVALDKFKGSLSAVEAVDAVCEGLRAGLPDAELIRLPLADGGEGTAEVFARALGGEMVEAPCHDALGRAIVSSYGWVPAESTAILEMSGPSGMWRLRKEELNPLETSTRGTGELLLDAARRGAKRILVGLGGSATNDGGLGLAAAIGFRFLDDGGAEVEPIPRNFLRIARILPPEQLPQAEIVAISDVRNPLLGEHGATAVFGPQKGAGPEQLAALERGLAHFADVIRRDLGCEHREIPGAGAAGGLGFGLLSFLGARIEPGFDAFAKLTHLDDHLAQCDLVITGEGLLDSQTLHGKGPGGLAGRARTHGRPVLAIAGALRHEDRLADLYDACFSIAPGPITVEESMRDARALLARTATQVAKVIARTKAL